MPISRTVSSLFCCLIAVFLLTVAASAQSSAFTYQGKLTSGGSDAAGAFDLKFRLYDLALGGAQQGAELVRDDVAVTAGVFSVSLDFGNQFAATGERWLEIEVREGASNGAYTLLAPRQRISTSPFAVQTINAQFAVTAGNAQAVGGIPAANIVNTSDARLSDARPPTAGSGNYVQNTTAQQPTSNFNISGNGTAGGTLSGQNVNATFEYRLGGQPFLRSVGTNMSFGVESGAANLGVSNTYSGYGAGQSATSNASNNSFFGARAGRLNSSGLDNSFFGNNSGEVNSTGGFNAFFGSNSGAANIAGNRNAFFGVTAGRDNTLGSDNTFVGGAAGQANQSGNNNSFFGSVSGTGTTTGSNNSFFGRGSGNVNVSGTFNTAIGDGANFGSGNLSFATAIGSGAIASANNTVVLGRPSDAVQIPGNLAVTGAISGTATNATQLGGIAANQYVTTTAGNANYIQNTTTQQAGTNFNISGTGTANILNAATQFNLNGSGIMRTGPGSLYLGVGAGDQIPPVPANEGSNTMIGTFAGSMNFVSGTQSRENVFIGWETGRSVSGASNSFFGYQAGRKGNGSPVPQNFVTLLGAWSNAQSGLENATAVGFGAYVGQSNSLVLGSINGINGAIADTNVGIGTTAPTQRLHVVGNGLFSGNLTVNGTLTAALPAGSSNYIQNSTNAQAASNFNISGTGKANSFDTATRFKIRGSDVFSIDGNQNVFLGVNVGNLNLGNNNAFAGSSAGRDNTNGQENSFFGAFSGQKNNSGGQNSFFGAGSGDNNTSGTGNTFAGYLAGASNESGNNNTMIGFGAMADSNSLSNATAIGAFARVTQSNSMVLGNINGVASSLPTTNVGIGTTAPSFRFHVRADGQDGIKIQHTGTGAFPQIRFTDATDTFKASIGVDTSGTGSMNFFVNGADRMIFKSNGVVQVPGAIFINNPNTLVITSPNGACWGITVNNSGVLSTFPVNPCP